jgi:hypothetical protein
MSTIWGEQLVTLRLPDDKYELLRGTTYNSRGWTFQELFFSERILFVTEQEVVFHCDTSRRSESLPNPTFHRNGEFGSGDIHLRAEDIHSRFTSVILES